MWRCGVRFWWHLVPNDPDSPHLICFERSVFIYSPNKGLSLSISALDLFCPTPFFQGDDVLTDDTRVTADNPLPYFMFNLHEPGEEEMSEFRKEQRRKNRTRIDTKDWSRVSR